MNELPNFIELYVYRVPLSVQIMSSDMTSTRQWSIKLLEFYPLKMHQFYCNPGSSCTCLLLL